MEKLLKQQNFLKNIYKYLSFILFGALLLVVIDYFDKKHSLLFLCLILLVVYWLAITIVLKYNNSKKVVGRFYDKTFLPSSKIVKSVKMFGINCVIEDNKYKQLLVIEPIIYKGDYYIINEADSFKLFPTKQTVIDNRISLMHLYLLEIRKSDISKFYNYTLFDDNCVYLSFGGYYNKKEHLVNYMVFDSKDYDYFKTIISDKEVIINKDYLSTNDIQGINNELDELYELRRNEVITPDVFYKRSVMLQKELEEIKDKVVV